MNNSRRNFLSKAAITSAFAAAPLLNFGRDYQNKIEGILLNVSLSPSSGFATQYGNFGAMEHSGLELCYYFIRIPLTNK